MQITIESDAIWGTPRITKYLGRSHMFSVLRELKAGRVEGARCIGGRWCVARHDLDAYKSGSTHVLGKRATA